MPKYDDDSEEEEEMDEDEVEEEKAPQHNYEELDENKFKKHEKIIWDAYVEARKEHLKEKEDDDHAEEDEDEHAEDDFDKEGFIEKLVEEKQYDENRVKMVITLGIYSGELNEFNERHGMGYAIYPNRDEYLGSFENNVKHGNNCKYFYFSQHHGEKTLLEQDVWIEKVKKEDESIQKLLGNAHEDGDHDYEKALSEAANEILKRKDCPKYLSKLRVMYVLKYGCYPFYEGSYYKDKKRTAQRPEFLEGLSDVEEPSNIQLQDVAIMKYKDGTIYKGQFYDNKKHGFGEIHYPNGDAYVGEWKFNLKHGKGEYYFAGNKSVYQQAIWENGQVKSGQWKMCDGVIYESNNFNNQLPWNSSGSFIFTTLDDKKTRVNGKFIENEWQPSQEIELTL
ncbi:hypothetical protein ABK040_010543 [Willaertia magna]